MSTQNVFGTPTSAAVRTNSFSIVHNLGLAISLSKQLNRHKLAVF